VLFLTYPTCSLHPPRSMPPRFSFPSSLFLSRSPLLTLVTSLLSCSLHFHSAHENRQPSVFSFSPPPEAYAIILLFYLIEARSRPFLLIAHQRSTVFSLTPLCQSTMNLDLHPSLCTSIPLVIPPRYCFPFLSFPTLSSPLLVHIADRSHLVISIQADWSLRSVLPDHFPQTGWSGLLLAFSLCRDSCNTQGSPPFVHSGV